jgi:tight adherence protein C
MNWLSLIRLGLGMDDLVVASATIFVLMALGAVWHGLVVRDPMAGRVRALAERRNQLRSAARTRENRARKDLRSSGISMMRQAVSKLKLMRGGHVEQAAMKLARAGWRSRDAVIIYLFAKIILPITFCGGALLFFSFTAQSNIAPMLRIIVTILACMIGIFGVDVYVKNVAERRVKEMTKAMPDALDLLVICAEAGLSLDTALTRVGREIAVTSPVLAEEFSLTAIELGFLPSRQAALNNLMNRTNMPNLRALVNSLIQTERYGTPLANSLRVLSAEFRDERMMRAEEKAAKLPAKMTVPMIVFIMPALFIVLGGPAIIQVMHTFSRGG